MRGGWRKLSEACLCLQHKNHLSVSGSTCSPILFHKKRDLTRYYPAGSTWSNNCCFCFFTPFFAFISSGFGSLIFPLLLCPPSLCQFKMWKELTTKVASTCAGEKVGCKHCNCITCSFMAKFGCCQVDGIEWEGKVWAASEFACLFFPSLSELLRETFTTFEEAVLTRRALHLTTAREKEPWDKVCPSSPLLSWKGLFFSMCNSQFVST